MPGMIDQVLEGDRDARQRAGAGSGVDQVSLPQRSDRIELGECVEVRVLRFGDLEVTLDHLAGGPPAVADSPDDGLDGAYHCPAISMLSDFISPNLN